MLMDLSPIQQRSSLILDLDIRRPSPVFSESMSPINSCLEMTGSGNTIRQLIGLPGKWNSDGAWRNPVPWSVLLHTSPQLPPIGQPYFHKYLDKSTSMFFLHTDLVWTLTSSLRMGLSL